MELSVWPFQRTQLDSPSKVYPVSHMTKREGTMAVSYFRSLPPLIDLIHGMFFIAAPIGHEPRHRKSINES